MLIEPIFKIISLKFCAQYIFHSVFKPKSKAQVIDRLSLSTSGLLTTYGTQQALYVVCSIPSPVKSWQKEEISASARLAEHGTASLPTAIKIILDILSAAPHIPPQCASAVLVSRSSTTCSSQPQRHVNVKTQNPGRAVWHTRCLCCRSEHRLEHTGALNTQGSGEVS